MVLHIKAIWLPSIHDAYIAVKSRQSRTEEIEYPLGIN